MDQYHGHQNIGSSYKYIVNVSPQTLLVTLFSCHIVTTYFHITLYVQFTPYNPWWAIPIDNPSWRKSENQIVVSIGPNPQMVVVSHLQRYG